MSHFNLVYDFGLRSGSQLMLLRYLQTTNWIFLIRVTVCWVVTPCSDVTGYQRFEGPWCLHLQGDDVGSMALQNVHILPHHYTA